MPAAASWALRSRWPFMLPDGSGVLYAEGNFSETSVWVVDVETDSTRLLLEEAVATLLCKLERELDPLEPLAILSALRHCPVR